ncbi:MAG: hypothetical protein IPL65_17120 [Lewinellaceae bacterium]|nr:hypothetical protein [Lewinellaceae bacterium]
MVQELEPVESGGREIAGRYYTEKQIQEMEEKVRRLEAENQALKARLYDEMTKGKKE